MLDRSWLRITISKKLSFSEHLGYCMSFFFHFIVPQLHTFFFITIALMAGIAWHFLQLPFDAQLLLSFMLILSGLIYRELYGSTIPIFFLLPTAFLAGSFLCFWQINAQKSFQKEIQGCLIDIAGKVVTIESIQNPRFRYRIIIDIQMIKKAKQTQWQPFSNTIALYARHIPALLVSDQIEIEKLEFKEITNHSFNNYLAKEKIAATMFVDTLQAKIIKRPAFNLNRSIFYLRKGVFDELHKKINRETFQLFSSIFLGNRTAVKKQMDLAKEPFKSWGVSHYLARSGLHLVIFAVIWHFLLSLIPISYLLKQIFLLILILIYALLSWSSVSFERALLMFIIYKICLLSRTPSHYIHLITLVTFIVLCINPLQLFFLDFQLSFGITFALAWFNYIEATKRRVLLENY